MLTLSEFRQFRDWAIAKLGKITCTLEQGVKLFGLDKLLKLDRFIVD
jgi:hypothetical protein